MVKDCRTSSRVAKKRVGHCVRAVHNKNFTVNKKQNSDVVYTKTRVISNYNVHNGCSNNWRADWSKFVGRSYAEVVSSNPSPRLYIENKKVQQVNKLPATDSCKRKTIYKPTCGSVSPVTGKYKIQRPCTVTKQPVSKTTNNSAHYCVTNRFKFLSVHDTDNTDIQWENNKVNLISTQSHLKRENSQFESSNLSITPDLTSVLKNVTKTSEKKCVNTRQMSDTGTWCKKVNIDHNKVIHVGNNSEPLLQNSALKIVQQADQKHEKMCPRNGVADNKYELALAVKNKNKQKLQSASSDPTYQKWSEQNQQKFGFIPLGSLLLPKSNLKRVMGNDPIKLYDITKNSDSFNFMSNQIQVKSQLNPDVW